VENKHLGHVLEVAQAVQAKRDNRRSQSLPGNDGLLLLTRPRGLEPFEAACGLALGQGLATPAVILSPLHRLIAPMPPESLETPGRLRLGQEPRAGRGRYDQLRQQEAIASPNSRPCTPTAWRKPWPTWQTILPRNRWVGRMIEAGRAGRQARTCGAG